MFYASETTTKEKESQMDSEFLKLFFATFAMVFGYGLMVFVTCRFFMNKQRTEEPPDQIEIHNAVPDKPTVVRSSWFSGEGVTPQQTKKWRRMQ